MELSTSQHFVYVNFAAGLFEDEKKKHLFLFFSITFPTICLSSRALFFSSKNTLCLDYIIRTNSEIIILDLFVVFATSSTLMDDDASYE